MDLDPRTIDNYRSIPRCHILLRWGATPLTGITSLGVTKWINNLHELQDMTGPAGTMRTR